jgi:hypothetical protein
VQHASSSGLAPTDLSSVAVSTSVATRPAQRRGRVLGEPAFGAPVVHGCGEGCCSGLPTLCLSIGPGRLEPGHQRCGRTGLVAHLQAVGRAEVLAQEEHREAVRFWISCEARFDGSAAQAPSGSSAQLRVWGALGVWSSSVVPEPWASAKFLASPHPRRPSRPCPRAAVLADARTCRARTRRVRRSSRRPGGCRPGTARSRRRRRQHTSWRRPAIAGWLPRSCRVITWDEPRRHRRHRTCTAVRRAAIAPPAGLTVHLDVAVRGSAAEILPHRTRGTG